MEVLQNNPKTCFNEMDIVKIVYFDTPEKLLVAAAYNVNHHLVKLLKENKVKQISGLWQHKETVKHML